MSKKFYITPSEYVQSPDVAEARYADHTRKKETALSPREVITKLKEGYSDLGVAFKSVRKMTSGGAFMPAIGVVCLKDKFDDVKSKIDEDDLYGYSLVYSPE